MKRGGSLRWLSASRCVQKDLFGKKAWLFRVWGRYFLGKLFSSLPSFFPPRGYCFLPLQGVFFVCVCVPPLPSFPLHPHSALSVECGENPSSQYVSRRVKAKGKLLMPANGTNNSG